MFPGTGRRWRRAKITLLSEVRSLYPRMLSQNALKRIKGHLPQKREIVDWGPVKILTFLKFVEFFTDKDTGKFSITMPTIEAARRRALEEDWWDEFMARIEVTPGFEGGTIKKFSNRFLSLVRVPLSWLKSNPHAVTEEMYNIIISSPRMAWAAVAFKTIETEMGIQIVARDNGDATDPGRNNPTHAGDVRTPAVQFEQAKFALISLAGSLVRGLDHDTVKKMSAKDRIAAFDKLMNTAMKMMGAGRPSTVIFNNIKTSTASKSELEAAIMGYSGSQNNEQ